VEVISGLTPGERIVIDGADKLRDGAKIIVRSETGAPTPPDADKSGAKKRRSEGGQKQ
jgi:multidrug efflux system membrane fusion protein